MVNRVFIDSNEELVKATHPFVCFKFCERDDRNNYYRAAGYFLPQWYWQPILAICYPDGREINIHWRHTHVSIAPSKVVEILGAALKIAGAGLDPTLVKKNRELCTEAQDALTGENFDAALGLAEKILKAVDRGWIRKDAEKVVREAHLLQSVKKALDAFPADRELSEAEDEWTLALNLCLAREYVEVYGKLERLSKAEGDIGKQAKALLSPLGEVLSDSIEIHRVSLGRYRFGPDIYHQCRAEVRNRLNNIDELVLQYYALLEDGSVWAGHEGYECVGPGSHHRTCMYLSYLDVPSPDHVVDLRVEAWVGGRRIGHRHRNPGGDKKPWWNAASIRPLSPDAMKEGSWWNSLEIERSGKSGVRADGKGKVIRIERKPDPVHEEILKIYDIFDKRRFTWDARTALYRLMALGSKSLRFIVPLAYRHGAITTSQLLPVLARIPHEKAAWAILHNVGADDVTLKGPAARMIPWLDGQDHAPIDELVEYLKRDDNFLPPTAATALGRIGRKEGFLPLVDYLRGCEAGSTGAEAAVAALSRLTGRDFGLDPQVPLTKQTKPVKTLLTWWEKTGKEQPRSFWMAQALESMGFAEKGVLTGYCLAGDEGKLAAVLRKAILSERSLARRGALVLAMDMKLKSLGPDVLDHMAAIGSRDPNYGLVRNTLRALMTVDLLEKTLGKLDSSQGNALLDLVLVMTGQYELYPARGTRTRGDAWNRLVGKWKSWLDENRDALQWNAKEQMFEIKGE
jgi:hypothetical protein